MDMRLTVEMHPWQGGRDVDQRIFASRGRRPVFAFGNSDGDQQMLEYTAGGLGARFMGLVHHTDTAREFAYDRQSHIGELDKALDEATQRKWVVVDMKADWNAIFPPAKK